MLILRKWNYQEPDVQTICSAPSRRRGGPLGLVPRRMGPNCLRGHPEAQIYFPSQSVMHSRRCCCVENTRYAPSKTNNSKSWIAMELGGYGVSSAARTAADLHCPRESSNGQSRELVENLDAVDHRHNLQQFLRLGSV